MNPTTQKIGVFGGSFDPIHYGHLLLAEQCLESASLDRVLFIPAAKSPLKSRNPIATDRSRVEMLELAIADHPNFQISKIELDRGDVSYTVDTLQQLKSDFPDAELFLMIGADSLQEFDRWKSPKEILGLAQLLIIDRPNSDSEINWDAFQDFASAEQINQWKNQLVQSEAFEFSSTDLRDRAKNGRSLRYRTPRAVQKYIETQKTYCD